MFKSHFYTVVWCDLKYLYTISANVTLEQRQEREEQPLFQTLQYAKRVQPTPQ